MADGTPARAQPAKPGSGSAPGLNDINNYAERVRPVGVLYVDVYPFRVRNEIVEYLLFRRRSDIVLPGQWQVVSGKIRVGERIADAFLRQVVKKVGAKPTSLHKLASVNTFYDEYYDTVMMVPAAAALMPNDIAVILDEELHVEYRWVSSEAAHELLPFSAQHDALSVIGEAVCAGGASSSYQRLDDSAFSFSRT